MSELMILAVALTAIAVLVAFGYGLHALRMIRDQPDRKTLRLAALNLLEPSVTIGTWLTIFMATNAPNSSQAAQLLPLIAGVPLTVMLLAPIVTRAESTLHRRIAVYGCLRWLNTVALWGVMIGGKSGDDLRVALVCTLIVIGVVILWASVLHIGSSLESAKTQPVQ